MKLAYTVRFGHDEELIFAQQLGADGVVVRVDVSDPSDIDLAPAAHRTSVAGVPLVGVELSGLPREFEPWSNAVTGAVLAAEGAGVRMLLCASPTHLSEHLAADLEAVVATATATDVSIGLDTAQLLPEEAALLPAGDLVLELTVGLPPFAAGAGLPGLLAERVAGGGIGCLRFEGGGRPLGEGAVAVPVCLATIAGAGYDGFVRAGAPPLLGEDDDWHPKGAAGDLGYLRAVLQTLAAR